LLATKLFIPPARPNRVPRPRLIEQLKVSRPLTLIAAPAGFGKTTVLSDWTPHSYDCVTWMSIDEDDNDPTRFWVYVIAALQRLRADLGESALALLQSPQPPPISLILTTLINEIGAFPQKFSLALDDYHRIKTRSIHEGLIFLLDHLPENMRILLTARADPPLPIARLRARNQLTELRADDLRFTSDEAAVFLNELMGLRLSSQDIAMLESRTEGWIAGLQLAALSMQGREDVTAFIQAFSGSHRHVLTYLAEEVLERRPEGTLNFLLQTSVLDRLCGSLCDALTGGKDGQTLLLKLEQANLFMVPLDDQGKWYRYHHMFGEVLQSRLQQTEPELLLELHRRASTWFEQNGLEAEAVEHALSGKDWTHATKLIEANMKNLQLHGQVATALRWLGTLPDEAIHARPTLGLAHARLLVLVDEFQISARRLNAAEQAFRSDTGLDPKMQAALLGQAAAVREVSAFRLEYPGEVIIAAGREALALLPEDDPRRGAVLNIIGCTQYLALGEMQTAERSLEEAIQLTHTAGDSFMELITRAHLSQMRVIQGRLRAAEIPCEDILRLASQPGWEHLPAAGLGRVMWGRILYERNDLPGALEMLNAGIEGVRGYSLTRPEIIGCMLLAPVKLALRELTEARTLLERAWNMIQKNGLKQITIPVAANRARLLLSLGDEKPAFEWAQKLEPTAIVDPLDPALEYDQMTLARVWLQQGRLSEAQNLLARLLPAAEVAGRMGRVIEMLALKARLNSAEKQAVEAFVALERALILAAPEGFVRTFVDEGEPMRELLSAFYSKQENQSRRSYIATLLAAFGPPRTPPTSANHRPSVNQDLVEPLSGRELDVLRLIVEGLSNQAIAQKLFLSTGTVKVHIKHIYAKLDVNSRTQAVARVNELDLH
jgi:LuxR family maltose regulon positive regulatory protein